MTDAPYAPLIAKLLAAAEDALYASIRAACIEAAAALTAQQARERDLDAKLAVHVEALALARKESAKLSEAALAQARKSALEEAEAIVREHAAQHGADDWPVFIYCFAALRARSEEKTG